MENENKNEEEFMQILESRSQTPGGLMKFVNSQGFSDIINAAVKISPGELLLLLLKYSYNIRLH